MIPVLSDPQARRLHMRSQRLLADDEPDSRSPVSVIQKICGVQAQDLPSGLLSVRPRSLGLTAAQVNQAREEAAIAWIWCMRGTLHLVTAEDARWLVPLLGPALIAGDRRRMEQLGWDTGRTVEGLRLLEKALAESGTLTRTEIRDLLSANHLPFEGQAAFHLIYWAALEGMLCYGPNRGGDQTFTSFDAWLGDFQLLPRLEALARLARRYLEAYAPASPEDFASWSGIKLREAREGWSAISNQTAQVIVQDRPAWLLTTQLDDVEQTVRAEGSAQVIRLLPRYDTYLLGYANRDLAVDPRYARLVHPGGGQISAVVLIDGQAAGIWKTRRRKGTLEVLVEPFERLPGEVMPAIEAEVEDLGRFLVEKTVPFVK